MSNYRLPALEMAHAEGLRMTPQADLPHILKRAEAYVAFLENQKANSNARLHKVAELAHEANRVLQYANHEENQSQMWEYLTHEQKQSALQGVKILLENPNTSPKELHEKWKQHKIENGWVYGATKCEEKKTHPCLVPYEELSHAQHVKDFMFHSIVLTALKHI